MSKTKPKKTAAAKAATASAAHLFVFGLDETGKPRGARFAEAKDDIVSAAVDMKLHIVMEPPVSFVEIGMKLPMGRVYASGKAFVPPIKKALYDQLIEAEKQRRKDEEAHFNVAKGDAATLPTPVIAVASERPRTWEEINAGHLCLIMESPEDGWWPAVVLQREDDVLTLRLRDYPKLGTFVRHFTTVALLNPASA